MLNVFKIDPDTVTTLDSWKEEGDFPTTLSYLAPDMYLGVDGWLFFGIHQKVYKIRLHIHIAPSMAFSLYRDSILAKGLPS